MAWQRRTPRLLPADETGGNFGGERWQRALLLYSKQTQLSASALLSIQTGTQQYYPRKKSNFPHRCGASFRTLRVEVFGLICKSVGASRGNTSRQPLAERRGTVWDMTPALDPAEMTDSVNLTPNFLLRDSLRVSRTCQEVTETVTVTESQLLGTSRALASSLGFKTSQTKQEVIIRKGCFDTLQPTATYRRNPWTKMDRLCHSAE